MVFLDVCAWGSSALAAPFLSASGMSLIVVYYLSAWLPTCKVDEADTPSSRRECEYPEGIRGSTEAGAEAEASRVAQGERGRERE